MKIIPKSEQKSTYERAKVSLQGEAQRVLSQEIDFTAKSATKDKEAISKQIEAEVGKTLSVRWFDSLRELRIPEREFFYGLLLLGGCLIASAIAVEIHRSIHFLPF